MKQAANRDPSNERDESRPALKTEQTPSLGRVDVSDGYDR
jgi:hypothetical protein